MLVSGLAVAVTLYACSKDKTPTAAVVSTPETWVANMSAANEVPTSLTTGATGVARFVFSASGTIDYTINVSGLSALPNNMHIHAPGDATHTAAVIVGFSGYAVAQNGLLAQGSIVGVSATVSMDSLKALIRNGVVYAQVHTTAFPGGEIRGQLVKQ
jgi:hypothetical protein